MDDIERIRAENAAYLQSKSTPRKVLRPLPKKSKEVVPTGEVVPTDELEIIRESIKKLREDHDRFTRVLAKIVLKDCVVCGPPRRLKLWRK
jgi:hypothetical protein